MDQGRQKRISPPPSPSCSNREPITDSDDPHGLRSRFVLNQAFHFRRALLEIQRGEKRTCWLWFVLPTAPYVVDGVERGSSMNRHFTLRTNEQAVEYLRLPPLELEGGEVVDLRQNYLDMAAAVREKLQGGFTMVDLFGELDAPKAVSSFKLFRRISEKIGDDKVYDVCVEILDDLHGGTKQKKKKNLFRINSS